MLDTVAWFGNLKGGLLWVKATERRNGEKFGGEPPESTVRKGKKLADLENTSKRKYSGQRLLVVSINNYVYVAPYVKDKKVRKIFLKTLYPSRKLTKKYFKTII